LQLKPAVEQSSNKSVDGVAKENVRLNAKSLIADSDIFSSAINENEMKIITAYYKLESGVVDFNTSNIMFTRPAIVSSRL